MCGIVGWLHRDATKPINTPLLGRMTDLLYHRGPDDSGYFYEHGLAFGFRRLSIIDLAGGHQPMRDELRGRTIVFNGEVYNYREVRHRLEAAGVRFSTNSDTEVLLKAADFASTAWLEELNGMFGFAIWDSTSRTLMLGRDRLGVKPLYYTIVGDEFLFASEIKPFLLHPRVRREVESDAIPEYLAFRTVTGQGTLFRGIRQVPPGHVLLISQARFEPRIKRFWSEGDGKSVADYADPALSAEDQLEALLKQSVRYRLISDVPVGSFNSGGVDSSLNSAIMRSMTGGEMHTFSVGFEEEEFDESPYARRVAQQLGTQHHTLVVTEREYVAHLQDTLLHLEEPINHAHTVQLLLLSRLAKEYVTVVLTGEGADEVFGGYPRFQIAALAEYLRFAPRVLSKALLRVCEAAGSRKGVKLLECCGNAKQSIVENARYVPQEDLALVVSSHRSYEQREAVYARALERERTPIGRALFFDQRTYLPGLLTRLDRSSMAASVECRTPFLDVNVVEWSRYLDDSHKIRLGTACKYIVKKVAERWLPRDIVYRRKVGFGTPVDRWFRNPSGLGALLELLRDNTFRQRGYFDPQGVERLIREHVKGTRDHQEALWSLVNFEMWCRAFIDADGSLAHLLKDASKREGALNWRGAMALSDT